MNILFEPMNRSHAEEIISWHYDPPYDIYNMGGQNREDDIAYLLDSQNRFFAVICESAVIGFRSFGPDGRVFGGEYDDSFTDTGGGLRPDLTGRGLGTEIIKAGIKYGKEELGIEDFRVTVAAFNMRAIKVCERIGFKERQRFQRPNDNREFVVLEFCATTNDGALARSKK
ncbi:MAG: GNAT family N-acetyltransferase [Verrucomicrobiales bacterium]|nr:GNAT family N-acetyltransferase [Verrucomicrobiales bacterium]